MLVQKALKICRGVVAGRKKRENQGEDTGVDKEMSLSSTNLLGDSLVGAGREIFIVGSQSRQLHWLLQATSQEMGVFGPAG